MFQHAQPLPVPPWLTDPRDQIDRVLRQTDPVELRSPIVRRVASTGFVTEGVLSRLANRLVAHRIDAATLVVDLGCGGAGISLWLAERTSTRLIGIDSDDSALEQARLLRPGFSLDREPSFECTTFEATWMAPAIAHAVISIDALHLAADPVAALAEAHRILLAGGLLTFNVYVADEDPDAAHWIRALERVGFAMLDIDDRTETWREIMTAKHENRLEHAALVSSLLGERRAKRELATSRAMLGIGGPSQIETTRRVELVAYKARLARSGSCV